MKSEEYYTLDKLRHLVEIGQFGMPMEQDQYYVRILCPLGVIGIRPMSVCVDFWVERDGRAWVETNVPFTPTPNANFAKAIRWTVQQIVNQLTQPDIKQD
ncbi:hypothetical protein CLV58_12537 [Spirosoma oryzae]|uniref:Uncharacterized protein n=1 Tax=Spirosoma oryzae TaxID=1469603 RepID=A0A2T0S8L9_9BACT|nr:hypothetical protein CLV58_12537 [Spirosoma oryzae]